MKAGGFLFDRRQEAAPFLFLLGPEKKSSLRRGGWFLLGAKKKGPPPTPLSALSVPSNELVTAGYHREFQVFAWIDPFDLLDFE